MLAELHQQDKTIKKYIKIEDFWESEQKDINTINLVE